jgi:hypothetical protein
MTPLPVSQQGPLATQRQTPALARKDALAFHGGAEESEQNRGRHG